LEKLEVEIYQTEDKYYRVRPLPTKQELRKLYTDKYYQDNHSNYKEEYEEKRRNTFIYKVKQRIVLFRIMFGQQPGNMLDVGCGEGWALKTFHENGWKVTGLDYTDYACRQHNPDMTDNIILGDSYETMEAIKTKYQIIHLDNILEHVIDPLYLLQLCRKRLRPDGVLIIEVPLENSIFHQYLLKHCLIKTVFEYKYPEHLSMFNLEGLRGITKRAGFKEQFIGDFSPTRLTLSQDRFVVLENFLFTLPLELSMRYFTLSTELGFGTEMMGFFTREE